MASDKKRRKAAKAKRPRKPGPFRHPDGDRRHRGGMTYDQGAKDKELLRRIGAVELPQESAEDDEDPPV